MGLVIILANENKVVTKEFLLKLYDRIKNGVSTSISDYAAKKQHTHSGSDITTSVSKADSAESANLAANATLAWGKTQAEHHNTIISQNISSAWDNSGITTRNFEPSSLTNQPSENGNLLSIANGANKSQMWFSQPGGNVYHRQGNSSGWNATEATEEANSWSTFLDSNNWLDIVYPVGSIYVSVNNVSPASLFGGTWEWFADRVLIGAGNLYPAESSSFVASRKHSHTEGNLAAAIGASANEAITLSYEAGTVNPRGPANVPGYTLFASRYIQDARKYNHYTPVYGTTAEATVSTLPPYFAVYMWVRRG